MVWPNMSACFWSCSSTVALEAVAMMPGDDDRDNTRRRGGLLDADHARAVLVPADECK